MIFDPLSYLFVLQKIDQSITLYEFYDIYFVGLKNVC